MHVIVTVIILTAMQCVYMFSYSYYKERLAILCTYSDAVFTVMSVHFFPYTNYLAFSYIVDGQGCFSSE